MGNAVLPDQVQPGSTNLRKLEPLAKPPYNPVLQALTSTEVKVLKRMLAEPVEYVHDDLLDHTEADVLLQRPLHVSDEEDARQNDDSGVFMLAPQGHPVWGLERERFLFLRLNYCRREIFRILDEHKGRRLNAEAAAELLRWEGLMADTRDEIVRQNMPLVLAMAKRTRITAVDLTDLISEGNMALMRAVKKYDSSRGYRFSTYACRAILKSFSRVAARASRHRGHFPTEFDPELEKSNHLEQIRLDTEDHCVQELKSILTENLADLSDVERKVIAARFALDNESRDEAARKAKTLEQVGELIGVTKERVRQIQNKALSKLRTALEESALTR